MDSKSDKKPNYVEINGRMYYRMRRKVGMVKNRRGEWVAKYKLFYGKTKKEAVEKYEAYMNLSSLDSLKSFGQLSDWYIENIFQALSYKDGTKTLYINAFHALFDDSAVAGKQIAEIDGQALQEVISGAKVEASTVHAAVKLLRLYYKYLEAQHVCTDVTRSLVLPKVKKKKTTQDISIFTDEEVQKFLDKTPKDHRLRLLVVLGIFTGARVGELLGLTYDDITESEVRINKQLVEIDRIVTDENSATRAEVETTKTTASVRSIPVNDVIRQALKDHKKWHTAEMKKNGYKTPYIFTTSNGTLYFKSSVRQSFKRLCKTVGVEPQGFHVFRHTFGSKLAQAHVPIETTCKLLGHDSIQTTQKYYVNISTDEKITAINTIKFG